MQAPSAEAERGHAVVLCNPFGQEAIRCHRLMRVIGERLAREGFHVLRFDYFATGDSDGDDAEGDLAEWADDVLRADAEARRLSGNGPCSWFGARLGGTLAAAASARATPPPERLVLWDPVVDGPAYLEELRAAQREAIALEPALVRAAGGGSDGEEALGFPLTPALRTQLGALPGAAFAAARARRIVLLASDGAAPPESLQRALERNGRPAAVADAGPRIRWASNEALNTALAPAQALQAVLAAFCSP